MFLEGLGYDLPGLLVFGALVAVAELVDVVPYPGSPGYNLRDDPFATGPFCWILRDIRPLDPPLYCRGRLGLWEINPP